MPSEDSPAAHKPQLTTAVVVREAKQGVDYVKQCCRLRRWREFIALEAISISVHERERESGQGRAGQGWRTLLDR